MDRIRNFSGYIYDIFRNVNINDGYVGHQNGVFKLTSFNNTGLNGVPLPALWQNATAILNPSLVVPVGLENSSRTLSVRSWRRVA